MLTTKTGNETNIKLPFFFILTGLAALMASQLLLLFNSGMAAEGIFRIPPIWAAAHLMLLGWALMTAMGAMYQLVPVAFLTAIWSEKFGFLQFWVTAAGIGSFSAMLYLDPSRSLLPGVLMLSGILMFLLQMAMTLKKQASPTILTVFVGTALVCLFATIVLGIMMTNMMAAGERGDMYGNMFKSHILLGTAGWFTLLIFGFSYKMVPMFSLAHGFSMKPAGAVYFLYTSGLAICLAGFWVGSGGITSTGLAFLAAGFTLFTWHIKQIIKARLKKKLDKPFSFALLAIKFGAGIHFAALLAYMFHFQGNAFGPLIYLYIVLWIAYSILGYLYKIVPFLWWTHKYSKEIGKKDVPPLKVMVDEKLASPVFISLALSAVIVFLAIIVKSQIMFVLGQSAVSLLLLIISCSILMVLRK